MAGISEPSRRRPGRCGLGRDGRQTRGRHRRVASSDAGLKLRHRQGPTEGAAPERAEQGGGIAYSRPSPQKTLAWAGLRQARGPHSLWLSSRSWRGTFESDPTRVCAAMASVKIRRVRSIVQVTSAVEKSHIPPWTFFNTPASTLAIVVSRDQGFAVIFRDAYAASCSARSSHTMYLSYSSSSVGPAWYVSPTFRSRSLGCAPEIAPCEELLGKSAGRCFWLMWTRGRK